MASWSEPHYLDMLCVWALLCLRLSVVLGKVQEGDGSFYNNVVYKRLGPEESNTAAIRNAYNYLVQTYNPVIPGTNNASISAMSNQTLLLDGNPFQDRPLVRHLQ